jgi:phytanoyl-CoA hydroxylase
MEAEKIKYFYDINGYIVEKKFLPESEISDLIDETEGFIKDIVPNLPREAVFYENKNDPSTLKQIQHLDQYSSYFKKLASSPKVIELAELLLGGKVVLKNMQYFDKIPLIGKETPAHQDGYYFKIRPQIALTMWLSMGDADGENGAVTYIPGSHKTGMRPHGNTEVLGFSQGITDWSENDSSAEIQMTAEPGDLLVHHSLTIHRANPNRSTRHRKSIGFIFYREDVVIDEEAHTAYKNQLKVKLQKQGKI